MNTRLLIIILLIGIVGTIQIPELFSEESDSQNLAQIKWFGLDIQSEIPVYKIQVTDKDMNENPDEIDKFKIRVWSNSDPIGIIVSVYETGKNSGLFDSSVYFSKNVSVGQRLRVYDGDAVTAAYEDRTLPSSHTSNELEVSDTITIYYPITNPLENKSPFIRIEDETFSRQLLQTGETISESGAFTSLIIGSLGPILIMFFIALYTVKKIRAKKSIEK